MENLLLNIAQKLESEVNELKYIDENWGQLMYYGSECPVKFPCALVDFASGQFSNVSYNYRTDTGTDQEGDLRIEITIAKLRLSPTNVAAKLSQKTKGYEVWAIVNKIHNLIHGWKPLPDSGELSRTSIQQIKRDDGIKEIIVTYSIGLHGC